ncbi:MAG: M67 family metallopeptidase [Clostridium sp.]|jgi:proteasome lid subunit RPN8/RPN11|uniref:M67 family metallopeptidase n=1 Tax=Clostridium sp. TaxID=1506 RepID=UPI0025B87108|nr:M67 family metallopeptidase [Clostridium sp.]MCH3965770.1 M67 family metallopeptidase [Clostridium sp.]MCI1717179.1 M67 family metallopeptidase [Clostridium sp.]MCI1801519.1 M67 family metallopeptidase [Clostridium sp.]MCI1815350.1 M67 family metallopeptidase [Clostridium sp.]MCI1872253.1 M67 family metallopeptidase [Clostridium sp.]
MIYIDRLEYEKIIEQARRELPDECCGYLAGNKSGADIFIKEVYALTNIDHSNEHFSMDPKEQFNVIKSIRKKGLEVIGNYHSHPESPSRPSEEDKRLAFDPNILYGILSLQKQEPVFNLFKISKDKIVEKLAYKVS